MNRRTKLRKKIAIIVALTTTHASANVTIVSDLGVIGTISNQTNMIITAITGGFTATNTNLANLTREVYNVGMAVVDNANKVSNTVDAASQADRELEIEQEKNRRIDGARHAVEVPNNICSESGSSGVPHIVAASGAAKGTMRPTGGGGAGSGGINNGKVSQAVNTPPVSPEADAARAASVHAQYCDSDDYTAYGGSSACPSASTQMPDADKRLDSILAGAGPNGKIPDLTFNQEQNDAARMYTQNSIRRSIAPQLKKVQANTIVGSQYVGLMNQYNAIISAAAEPQDARLADSLPNPATKEYIKQATENSPSAKTYYELVASAKAKAAGFMSTREFERFEVGRRYSNVQYNADLQAMSAENLQREKIRAQTLNTSILVSVKDELQKNNILRGQILATGARQEFSPIFQQIADRMGGQ